MRNEAFGEKAASKTEMDHTGQTPGPLEAIIEQAARVVFAGGTVIFPTDTSYAIGCDPYRAEAIDRIYAGKRRADGAPLTLHVASPQEFLEYAGDEPIAALAAKRLLPGPVIFLIRKPRYVPGDVAAGRDTLAIRVPDEPVARALLERCGPLAGTTAGERSTWPAADLLLEHGPTKYGSESTILDISGRTPRLIREGVVPERRLSELLGPVERPTVKVRTQQ